MRKAFHVIFPVILILVALSFFTSTVAADGATSAPDFTTVDENGTVFSLSDYRGHVTLLHFTGLESPLCIECLEEMEGQLVELENLSQSVDNVRIITVNIRNNPYSISGKEIAELDYGISVNWHWVEDFSPYSVAYLYRDY